MYETVYKSYSGRQKGGLTTKCYGQLFEAEDQCGWSNHFMVPTAGHL